MNENNKDELVAAANLDTVAYTYRAWLSNLWIKGYEGQLLLLIMYSLLLIGLSIANGESVLSFSWKTVLLIFAMFVISLIFYFLKNDYNHPLSWMLEWSPLFLITYVYRILVNMNENLIVPRVHVKEPYMLEKSLFSWIFGGTMPNTWFYTHFRCSFVTFIVGIVYFTDLFVPVGIMVYSWLRKDRKTFNFGGHLLATVGLYAVLTFAIYPAAPPWYVQQFGFSPPDIQFMENYSWYLAARLTDFDQLIRYPFYQQFYTGMSRDFFAAIPSVHVAYGIVTIFIAYHRWKKKSLLLSLPYAMLVIFSAVYTNHHYLFDAVCGIICAFIALASTKLLQLCGKRA
ncbi:MAG: phosphatase PAP2 family protein [Candidatus Heimdallarchaeaceae archaeon]